jgi:ribosomal protein S18 acetylase RimI-like enzyme
MNARLSTVRLASLRSDEVELLQRVMPSTERIIDGKRTNSHAERYAVQHSGSADYLIAWLDGEPVGHALLRWNGPADAITRGRGARGPYIEGLAVRDDRWSRGIGTAMMVEAERRALERGHEHMWLAVGVENERARRLYRKLGYGETGSGEFDVTWAVIDGDGNEGMHGEVVTLLKKKLSPRGD